MIRLATIEDLDIIASIADKAVRAMNAEGSDQWDESYPTIGHFEGDINHSSLFVYEDAGNIVGFVTADQELSSVYDQMDWTLSNDECGTFHRLAVDPDHRKSGVAAELITFVEAHFKNLGLKGIKMDTYSINEKAQRLFKRLGYHKVGEFYLEDRSLPFFGYEKRF